MKEKLTPTALVQAMAAVIESEGYKYLTGYKNDFYVHDVANVMENYEPGVTYLWVVRENGTHLNVTGVHKRESESAIAAMEAGARATALGCALYLVSSSGVKQVDEKQARHALVSPKYEIAHNAVIRKVDSTVVATYSIRHSAHHDRQAQCFDVHFQASNLEGLPTHELADLRTIAFRETEAVVQSLFVKITDLRINGVELNDLIAHRRSMNQKQTALA